MLASAVKMTFFAPCNNREFYSCVLTALAFEWKQS